MIMGETLALGFLPTVQLKFAELLVKECTDVIDSNTPCFDLNESRDPWNQGYEQAMMDCIHHLKEHFGIEE
jgi:hypothetical protein